MRPGTTASDFPFGIVSLHAGGSEGHPYNMANFRHAQTANYGFLPGPKGSGMERTFIAQAYDIYTHAAPQPSRHCIACTPGIVAWWACTGHLCP